MDKPQTKLLIGLASGAVVASGAFLVYSSMQTSADEVKSDTKAVCDGKETKADVKAIKGDDGKYYKGDVKTTFNKEDIKDDSKVIKYDGKFYQSDGKKYDAKPSSPWDGKLFKYDGKYFKTDGKEYAKIDPGKLDPDAKLLKVDGKILTKSDEFLKSDGKVFVLDGKTIVCDSDGFPISVDIANGVTVVMQLDPIVDTPVTTPKTVTTPVTAPTTTSATGTSSSATTGQTVVVSTGSSVASTGSVQAVDLAAIGQLTIPIAKPAESIPQRIGTFFRNIWNSIVSIF